MKCYVVPRFMLACLERADGRGSY